MSAPDRIPLARPSVGEAELEATRRVLESGRLVLGPENEAFEKEVARRTGCTHGIAVSNGTTALWAALWALDLEPGEVLVPAFTFPAPAHVAAALGFEIVPVDVDPATWNIDPDAVAQAWTTDTRALIVVDQFGLCADYDRLKALAGQADTPILEDAACAIGARTTRAAAGSFGKLACFSFHPRKVITTGEGGCIVTSDDKLARRVRAYRHQGQESPGVFVDVGVNFRLPETCAAMGRAQLDKLDGLLLGRAEVVTLYRQGLEKLSGLGFQEPPHGWVHAWQTFAVVLPEGTSRATVIGKMAERGIETGPATYALHRVGSLAGRPSIKGRRFPVADALHDRALALPLYGGMTESEVGRVIDALRATLS